MIFLTVGTSFPFDRLVRSVDDLLDEGVIEEEVFAQVGVGGYRPRHMECCELLDKAAFDARVEAADSLVSHAGMGTITNALEHGKPLLVMPRLKRHGELVNDHQIATARKFGELRHVLVAHTPEELRDTLPLLHDFVPEPRVAQAAAVAERIARFLADLRT